MSHLLLEYPFNNQRKRRVTLHFCVFGEDNSSLLFLPTLELMEFLDKVIKGYIRTINAFNLSSKARKSFYKANVTDLKKSFKSMRVSSIIRNGTLFNDGPLARIKKYGERIEKQYLEAFVLIQGVVLEELLRLLVDDEECFISSDFMIMGSYIEGLFKKNRLSKNSEEYGIMEDIKNKRNAMVHGKDYSLETVKRNGELLMDTIRGVTVSAKDLNNIFFPDKNNEPLDDIIADSATVFSITI